MRTIYVEPVTFYCHTTQNDDGTLIPVETNEFNGKCDDYIKGFRFVPDGHTWIRDDGKKFNGKMKSPWKPYAELDEAQREYERALIADMQNALNKLGVTLDE